MEWKDLTAEQQAKFQACENAEAIFEVAKAEGMELSDEDLQRVSGGRDQNWFEFTHPCEYCGGRLTKIGEGEYKCRSCGRISNPEAGLD